MEAIESTFGYGRTGTHKKKCEICGLEFDEPNDLDVLVVNGPSRCPHCKDILRLRDVLHKQQEAIYRADDSNETIQANFYKVAEQSGGPVQTETYQLDEYDRSFEILRADGAIGRTKWLNEFIERLKNARDYLYFQVGPQMEILKSIYETHDAFWDYGGNFIRYSSQASVEFVVTKLKEYLSGESKYSISKIRNILANDKRRIYDDNHITEIKKFKKSGQIAKTEYPHFPIEDYLKEMDNTLQAYASQIKAIKDIRDNEFAHFGNGPKSQDSEKEITYSNIKRIYNSLLIIYDGFLFSVAPDLYANYSIDYQMWFAMLNEACEDYEKMKEIRKKELQEAFQKEFKKKDS